MSIKPFAEQGHYTAVHDAIFDEVMPVCPPNAWKVLCFIVRKTRGWGKDEDALPYNQILEGTGISSKATLSSSLKWLVESSLIIRDGGRDAKGKQRTAKYRLNHEYELNSGSFFEPEPSTEIEHGVGTENEPGPSTEIEHFNNHRVSQEPKSKNQSTSTEEDSLQSSSSVPESGKTKKQKSPEDHTGKLVDDLEEINAFLDRRQIKAYSGNFGRLKEKGVSHSEIVRCRQRIVSEWHRIQLSPQAAHSDLQRESGRDKSALNGVGGKDGERRRGGSAIRLTPEQAANPKETYSGRI